ncbi:MAG: YifB family Mg chelatase-like AAA ATPase [Candidatus Dependentiae bacterium]|nr:YifB family Mg chelatase-like AAA ATPase [Candidatus Dependentiae bacterium]
MYAHILSATTVGVNARIVQVEVDAAFGMVNFYIVGLPDAAIRESSKRILSALKNSGFRLPNKKITVNLAPADLKKEGTLFDLPIAIGILMSMGMLEITEQIRKETLFLGELSLDGSIRFVKGALAIAYDAQSNNIKRIILPKANAPEVSLIEGVEVVGVDHLTELVAYMRGEITIEPTRGDFNKLVEAAHSFGVDFAQVKGQSQAKRALQITAAGRHNILFIGSPGSGKTMLAKRLPTIMPKMSFEEVLETTKLYSVCGKLDGQALITQRPFRAPHHTISQAGLIGGGTYPQPGEISLSHHGILFLDELTEFKRDTLESLRQPLESQMVHIARVHQSISFPASFLLVAALNPCPCGFFGDKNRLCTCTTEQVERYAAKLSGPLLDRIDLQISVQSIEYDTIKNAQQESESSAEMFARVQQGLDMQFKRFGSARKFNSTMTPDEIEQFCVLTPSAEAILKRAFDKLRLSMRGYHKVLKVARTIADLEEAAVIDAVHIREAILYRSLDQHVEQQRG